MLYIKLEDLQKFPIRRDHYDKKNGSEKYIFGVEDVLEYAEYLPTADVVEVTRCKNCQHYEADIICEGVGYCNEHQKSMRDNDFCSCGERRKDDMKEEIK